MNKNLLIVAVVVLGVVAVAWFKSNSATVPETPKTPKPTQAESQPTSKPFPQLTQQLPRLVELGAGKCQACKMMAPIIEAIKEEYDGKLTVESVDVLEQADHARTFNWQLIPCQVFLDAKGNELWRHVGFLSKEDIVTKLKELGMI